MPSPVTTRIVTGLVLWASLLLGSTTFAADNALPRSFGAFTLGMSVEEFHKLTGVKPSSCPVCVTGELFATLNSDQALRHTPSDLIGHGIDFFFYDGRLYQMAIAPPAQAAAQARNDFVEFFGPPAPPESRGNGIARLKWQSPNTLLTLSYHTALDQAFVINFYDASLLLQRQQQQLHIFRNAGIAED